MDYKFICIMDLILAIFIKLLTLFKPRIADFEYVNLNSQCGYVTCLPFNLENNLELG